VRRHDLDVFSLVTGLVFVAVAVGHLLDESSQLDFDGRWVVPLVLVAVGVPEARPGIRADLGALGLVEGERYFFLC